MKQLKYLLLVGLTIVVVGIFTINIFAKSPQDPVDIIAELTGKSTDEIIQERYEEDKPLSVIAAEAGMFDEFRDAMRNNRQQYLLEQVEEGNLTQEEADDLLEYNRGFRGGCHGGYGFYGDYDGYGHRGMMGRGRGY